MPAQKQLWLLAGGNGAGKSTFYRLYLEPEGIGFVNADLIAKQIDKTHPELASYQAARLAEKLRSGLLGKGISFCFETVFSHPSKIDFVAQAKALGYEVVFVYIHLLTDELNQARVAQRVSEGGHDVPADKIISRIPRTMANVITALALADVVQLYDNSSKAHPYLNIAQIKAGVLTINHSLPTWAREILINYLC